MRVPTGTSPSEASLMPLITGHMASRVIFVAAELNLADLIAEGCQTIAELANRTRTHAPSLERILRTLGSLGVLDETEPGKFSHRSGASCGPVSLVLCATSHSCSATSGHGNPGVTCCTACKPENRRRNASTA